ncbi:MAG: PSD1 and planctomycete cytochrome C domain-containing protein [Bryobacteraceae bacterium]
MLLCAASSSGQDTASNLPPPASTAPDFVRDIEPIFAKRCQACHGSAQQMNGLRLDSGEEALKGGYSGPVIIPGKSAESKLIHRVASTKTGFAMPPAGEKLSKEEVGMLRAWIDAGAKWPASEAKAPNPKSTHWSYQPIERPEPPKVKNSEWVRNPIDAFVLARLEKEGIEPAPEASKNTLARRVYLDLIGLPPEPKELEAFLADDSPGAYERLVDRLLESPHYGEKWARHWLDLAHYADSDGYEKDLVRPWAWRYRHWVINAINRDMPFDRFTVAQLAGDLLSNSTVEQRVATGFLRNTLTNREAGVDRAEARFEQTVNRSNTVGTAWLGLTVGCAQCHNHKYDAISQKEFYQFFAFFDGIEEVNIDAPLPGEIGPYMQARPEYERKRTQILTDYHIPDLQAKWETKMIAAIDNPGANLEWDFAVTSFKAMVDGAVKLIKTPPPNRSERDRERLTAWFLRSSGPEYSKDESVEACIKEARGRLADLDGSFTPLTQAQTVAKDPGVKTHIALGGDYRSPGIEVQPGTLAVLPPLEGSGRADRLDLARWLVSPENPLTARVTANRAWQEFFGKGLVKTSDDFGTQGEEPSHPELLDWLASEFQAKGWSRKQLHRTIVLSATYRQSSDVRKELLERDPENRLLARQSRLRLSAELIRDSALASGGLLNPAIGGESIRPPQPEGIAELGYANSVKWVESEGPERYRRGLYIHFQRTTPYPQLMTFDAPDSNVSCTRRLRSNTPLQALNLLNDPVFVEAAQGLARRVLMSPADSMAERVDYAYELVLARDPKPSETERLSSYYDQQLSILQKDPDSARELMPLPPEGVEPIEAAAWTGVGRVLLNLDEFITRE